MAGNTNVLIVSNVNISKSSEIDQILEIKEQRALTDNTTLVILGASIGKDTKVKEVVDGIEELKETYQKVYIIPSEKMWRRYNAEGIKDIDDDFQDFFDQDILIPDNACGELEVKELEDDFVLAVFDTNWYLQNWEEDKYINEGCNVKSRSRFWYYMREDLLDYKDKTVLFFNYHPPFSFNEESGYLPTKKYFLPVPYLSAIVSKFKNQIGGYTHSNHNVYKDYATKLERLLGLLPNAISISGKSPYQMEYNEEETCYLNVNTGKQKKYCDIKRYDWCSISNGYLIIKREGNEILKSWYEINDHSLLRSMASPLSNEVSDSIAVTNDKQNPNDSITTTLMQVNQFEKLNNRFLGHLNTSLYDQEVTVPKLYLNSLSDSLSTVRIGGGNQTTSVRLADNNENEFVVRSILKKSTNIVPPAFDIPVINKTIKYYFTASHPYGFMMSSAFENALEIHRTEPKLVFLPKQKSLTPYNDEIGDQLVLFRPRADGDMSDSKAVKYSKEIISTFSLIEKIYDGEAIIDAKLYLKCRLLDYLINDWDRHEDQWRWALIEKNGEIEKYAPIPRDRDQALCNYDGIMLSLLRYYLPATFHPTPFGKEIKKRTVEWNHYQCSFLDKLALSRLEKQEWDAVTNDFLQVVDEDLIDDLKKNLPNYDSPRNVELMETLKERIYSIEGCSEQLFEIINKNLFVIATNQEDIISISNDGDATKISIKLDKEDNQVFFERNIDSKYTKKVHIYSLDNDDEFIVEEPLVDKFKINYFEGFEKDKYDVAKKQKSNITLIGLKANESDEKNNLKEIRSRNKDIINLKKSDYLLDYNWFLPYFSINRDDGLLVGSTYKYFTFTERSRITNSFAASFATFTSSSTFQYTYLNESKISNYHYGLNLLYFGPRYEANFFGIGNGIDIDTKINRSFYFIRKQYAAGDFNVYRMFDNMSKLGISLGVNRSRILDVDNRFINQWIENNPEVGENQYYLRLGLNYSLKSFDSSFLPHNGISYNLFANFNKHLSSDPRDHVKLGGNVRLIQPFGKYEKVVYATKIGFERIIGDGFFYHQINLGGENGLRGFRRNRFTGDMSFYHSQNLHYYISKKTRDNNRFHSWGVSAYFDYGRVWSDQDVENRLLSSIGAGLFYCPFDVVVISGGYFVSDEESQWRIGLGWLLGD